MYRMPAVALSFWRRRVARACHRDEIGFNRGIRSTGRNRLPICAALLHIGEIAGRVLAVPILRRIRLAVSVVTVGAVIGVAITVIIVRRVPSPFATRPTVKPAAVPKAVPAAKMRAVKSATLGPAQAAGAEHGAMKTTTTEPAATEAATMEAAAEAAAVTTSAETAAVPTAATAPRPSGQCLGECHDA